MRHVKEQVIESACFSVRKVTQLGSINADPIGGVTKNGDTYDGFAGVKLQAPGGTVGSGGELSVNYSAKATLEINGRNLVDDITRFFTYVPPDIKLPPIQLLLPTF